ncbi:unnamed protein product [Paramecium sonneborni]|uniref:DNA-directed RNA polymerase n=1 Tax=Paramecium sonneborni TaxID=65129 RepID=A0A8S1NCS1_9CILI|nr:unnamed protein product [Paramecium sonneborni]
MILILDSKPQLKKIYMVDFAQNDAKTVFQNFVKTQKTEYQDMNESDNVFIELTINDVTEETIHLKIDQIKILSCITSQILFLYHNQSTFNTFQCQIRNNLQE